MSPTRFFRRNAKILAMWLVVVAVAAGAAALVVGGGGAATRTVTADFTSAPGIYVGNNVDVLGIEVGKVRSITATVTGARVVMTVPAHLKLPSDVGAMLIAPQLISDRYVQLSPAYSGGPLLAQGAVIPPARTEVSLSVDQILDSVDRLATALGPTGANANGSLSDLVHAVATTLGPDGKSLDAAITNLGGGFGALSNDGPALTLLFNSLGNLTKVASQNLGVYRSFTGNLASVSGILASDNSNVATALSDLQQVLSQISTFVNVNGTEVGSTVANLQTFAAAISSQQASLASTFQALPQALKNLLAAYYPDTPGGPTIKARFDPSGASAAFNTAVCGNSLIRLLSVGLATASNPDTKASEDLICGLNGVASSLPVPPGASSGPDLSVANLVAGAP